MEQLTYNLNTGISIGQKATLGAFWTTLSTILQKIVAMLGQIVLAWFLLPEDMGLVAMASSITGIAGVLTMSGLLDVLVQRSDHFEENAVHIFWLSLTVTGMVTLAVAALSPLASGIFGERQVPPLILIVCVSWPIGALSTVYFAALLKKLAFNILATIQLSTGVIYTGSAVALAALGFGPYALILPCLWLNLVSVILVRMAAGRIQLGRPNPRAWWPFLMPAFWVMLNTFFSVLILHGANFVIGIIRKSSVVGLYFWGYQLSTQTIFLLSANFRQVFFPSFSLLNADPERQRAAFGRAASALLVVTVPIACLQVLLAEPVIHLFFHVRWLPAAPVVRWLSIGLLAQPLHLLVASVLMAQGRFRIVTLLTGLQGGLVLLASAAGSFYGEVNVIAVWTGSSFLLGHLVSLFFILPSLHISIKQALQLFQPVVLAFPGALLAWGLGILLRNESPFVTIVFSGMTFLISYILLVRGFMKDVFLDLVGRVQMLRAAYTSNA